MHTTYESEHVTLSSVESGKTKGLFFKIKNNEKHHAISAVVLGEIHKGIDHISREGDADFICFYPEFDRLHVGADIKEFVGGISPSWIRKHTYDGVSLDIKIKELSARMKTLSVMFGERYGGSVEWPLMADYVICDDRAGIQFTESQLGIIPGWSGILNVMIKASPFIAEYMAKTGNRINAEQMRNLGIADDIVVVEIPPESADYKEKCEALFLDAILNAVTKDARKREKAGVDLEPFIGLDKEIRARTDVESYRELYTAYESGDK